MKEITILSGKGGTGKTSITAALVSLARNVVICDNDVDAADLHLILHPDKKEEYSFYGGWIASINQDICTSCEICLNHCRFDAIHPNESGNLYINPFQCEGCRLCERICPVNAIKSTRSENNHWYVSDSRFGPFIHAKMGPGEENSGKLVTQVRTKAKEIAKEIQADYLLNDGPPGIGCAAISSVSGTGRVLMVIEPTKSGDHDARRLFDLISSFNIPACAVINKFDINSEKSAEIEDYLREHNIPLLAKIPFDKDFVSAMIEGKSIIEFNPLSDTSGILSSVWEKVK